MKKTWIVAILFLMSGWAIRCGGGEPTPAATIKPLPDQIFKPESAERKPDKSRYNLFNTVPKDEMREMSTDRPDQTESAYTVDAGHYQIEMSLFDFSRDRRNAEHDGSRADTYTYGSTNFKMGVLNNVDLQFVFDPYIIERSRERNEDGEIFHETRQGMGDLTTRVKINLWGNDGGKTALALMPYVKIPTNQENLGNNDVEGGLIIPLSVSLPLGWDMGVMTQLDIVREEGKRRYHTEFFNTITFGHRIIGNLNGYAEFAAQVDTRNASRWAGQVDAGLTYGLTDDIQLDIGVNVGVTRPADDVNPFIGLSLRF
jgi:hypothetical protein